MQFTALRFSIVLKAIREWRADHIHEAQREPEPTRAIGFPQLVDAEEFVVYRAPEGPEVARGKR